MLKEWEPSPPVPQVSTTGSETATGIALSRITLAIPAISSTVSPLSLRAVTKAPNWAGVAWPAMISAITIPACSMVREFPETRTSIASLIILACPLCTAFLA